jgi:L-lactate dehydrogenase complex protein LldG
MRAPSGASRDVARPHLRDHPSLARGDRGRGAAPRLSCGTSGGPSGRRRAGARHLPPAARLDLFGRMVEGAAGSFERVAGPADIPAAVAGFLRRQNLPLRIRYGADARLAGVPWEREPALEIGRGASDGTDLAAVSHAFGAVAETGTLVMVSGPDNPTTLNFLPDVHIVVVDAGDVAGDFETVLGKVRERFGTGVMPRTVNLITGPSRSADIEQTLILGAHGPRKLHVIAVDAAPAA